MNFGKLVYLLDRPTIPRTPPLSALEPNQVMELTASGRYILPFLSLNPYPVAMLTHARGSSSWSRSMLRV